MEIFVFARLHSRPGRQTEVYQAMPEVRAPTRQEPGCLGYGAFHSVRDPDEFYIHTRWRRWQRLNVTQSWITLYVSLNPSSRSWITLSRPCYRSSFGSRYSPAPVSQRYDLAASRRVAHRSLASASPYRPRRSCGRNWCRTALAGIRYRRVDPRLHRSRPRPLKAFRRTTLPRRGTTWIAGWRLVAAATWILHTPLYNSAGKGVWRLVQRQFESRLSHFQNNGSHCSPHLS